MSAASTPNASALAPDAPLSIAYLTYRGNDATVAPHPRLAHLPAGPCPHYPPDKVGDPVFRSL